MIDPRALQQHFKKIHRAEIPAKPDVPRVPDINPLTAVQAIFVPEQKKENEEYIITEQPFAEKSEPVIVVTSNETLFSKKEEEVEEKIPINLVINVDPPIDSIIINEFEEEVLNDLSTEIEEKNTENEYDPYGYYSGPRY
jgi:hypothetical protein